MRWFLPLIGLTLSCAAHAATTPPKHPEHLVKSLDLGDGWRADAYQSDADPAVEEAPPARLCLIKTTATAGSRHDEDCTDLPIQSDAFHTIDALSLQTIPARHGTQKALLLRSTAEGGSIHVLHGLFVWTRLQTDSGGFWYKSLENVVGTEGTQCFSTEGPLAGHFVTLTPEGTNQKTMADPEHYAVDVYKPGNDGIFYETLHLLTDATYPMVAADGPPDKLLEKLTPWISGTLKRVYPHGEPQ